MKVICFAKIFYIQNVYAKAKTLRRCIWINKTKWWWHKTKRTTKNWIDIEDWRKKDWAKKVDIKQLAITWNYSRRHFVSFFFNCSWLPFRKVFSIFPLIRLFRLLYATCKLVLSYHQLDCCCMCPHFRSILAHRHTRSARDYNINNKGNNMVVKRGTTHWDSMTLNKYNKSVFEFPLKHRVYSNNWAHTHSRSLDKVT